MANKFSFLKCVSLLPLLMFSGCYYESGVEVQSYQGKPLKMVSQDYSWLAINYWATWCEPCREEIPELNHLSEMDNDIRVWGVDFDNPESLDALGRKIFTLGIEFPVVLPKDVPLLKLDMPQVLPATYLIAPDGSVKSLLLGPQTAESVDAAIDQLRSS